LKRNIKSDASKRTKKCPPDTNNGDRGVSYVHTTCPKRVYTILKNSKTTSHFITIVAS